jgi:putative ABC transport system substrate-binding protein
MNNRRKLLVVLGAGALAAPFGAFAQQQDKIWRVGVLSLGSGPSEYMEAFSEQLRSLGYVEGRNLLIEYRRAAGKLERLPELAAELVRLKVDVIVTTAQAPVVAAKRATSTIPIVMTAPSDPVGSGLVDSFAHPGGNVTGMSMQSTDLAAKRIQLLRELLPRATRVAVLTTYKNSPSATNFIEEIQTAAKKMGITLVLQQALEAKLLAGVFADMQRQRAQALVLQTTPFTNDYQKQIVELAARHRLPALFESRGFVEVGGLMSYGPSLSGMFRRAAFYVDRIFKGAKPADLPVEQPTTFEFVLNMRTAKALGIKISNSILLRADEVIE